MSGDTYSLTSFKIHILYAVGIIQILGVDLVGKWLREIHNITVPLRGASFLQSMHQRGRENCRKREYESQLLRREELAALEKLIADREVLDGVQLARLEELRRSREKRQASRKRENESRRAKRHTNRVERDTRENETALLRYHEKRVERETLEQLVVDKAKLAPEDQARLNDLQSAKKRNIETTLLRYHEKRAELVELKQLEEAGEELAPEQKAKLGVLQSAKNKRNEADRLYQRSKYQAKRQKRLEEAGVESHPMIKLLVTSRKNSSKLIQLVSDGIVKKVLTSYFVTGQTCKLTDKFIKTVDGCEEVTRHLILSCLNPHIPYLSRMKDEISAAQPLSTDSSNRAQTIILQLFPE
jgi:hypothetical protein